MNVHPDKLGLEGVADDKERQQLQSKANQAFKLVGNRFLSIYDVVW